MRKALFVVFIAVFAVNSFGQRSSRPVVGEVDGVALIRPARNAKQRQIKAGDRLGPDDSVRCSARCKKLVIIYCGVAVPYRPSSKWRDVYVIDCNTPTG